MQTKQDGRLGTEKIGKLMLELALPSVLAQIVNVLYNIVDRIFIGRQIAFDETVFRKQMKELERAAENECPDICERVKRMVPEYQYEGEKKHDGPSYTYSAGG